MNVKNYVKLVYVKDVMSYKQAVSHVSRDSMYLVCYDQIVSSTYINKSKFNLAGVLRLQIKDFDICILIEHYEMSTFDQ